MPGAIRRRLVHIIGIATMGLGLACAGPSPAAPVSSAAPTPAAESHAGTKRMVAGIMAEPEALFRPLMVAGHVAQMSDLSDDIVNVGMTTLDSDGVRQPILAVEAPSIDNGLWKVLPDGMEMTWRIKPHARWQDGERLTADDLVFTAKLSQDREVPELHHSAFDSIDSVEALDPSTVVVRWNKPYIWADGMFADWGTGFAQPLPKHILEQPYTDARSSFRQLPYWSTEFVGLGPYELKEWVAGSYMLLSANPDFVLGRPKIDEIEVRFILDPMALVANLLSGTVDVTLGTGMALEQVLQVRDRWTDGRMMTTYENWMVAYPQFINPNPAIVADVRYRRALLQAIDRQALEDTIESGLTAVAHSYVSPEEPEYKWGGDKAVHYDYDPRQASQGIEALGYTKGSDGMFRDASGQKLSMEVRATASLDIHTKTFFPVVDYWQRVGVSVDPVVIPIQRLSDLEYRTTQPTFEIMRHPMGARSVDKLRSSETPLPETNYAGRNRSRYMNPEFDALIDRYLATVPFPERMDVLGQIVYHISDQLNAMGLFYDLKSFLVSNRIQNVSAERATWNISRWDIQ